MPCVAWLLRAVPLEYAPPPPHTLHALFHAVHPMHLHVNPFQIVELPKNITPGTSYTSWFEARAAALVWQHRCSGSSNTQQPCTLAVFLVLKVHALLTRPTRVPSAHVHAGG